MKYRLKQPETIIDAIQYDGSNREAVLAWCAGDLVHSRVAGDVLDLDLTRCTLLTWPGTWIVRDEQGQHHLYTSEAFASIYEAVEEPGLDQQVPVMTWETDDCVGSETRKK
jgi:hypothetical protein